MKISVKLFSLCALLPVLVIHATEGLLISGCPIYGCRPSGSFSFSLNVPKSNASIAWVSDFFCGPVPNALGCVGNDVSLICQSNGPASDDVGYVAIDASSGTVRWRDGILKFPTLPVMSNYGDISGTDGSNLVHYHADGKLEPVIHLDGQNRPIFSIELVGTDYLLIVSQKGVVAVRFTNGIPVASLVLTGNVERSNGTFLTVAQPVVNGNRFYLLTEFVPESEDLVGILNMRRLYAIDVHDRLSQRLTIAWYFNFEREEQIPDGIQDSKLRFKPRQIFRDQEIQKQRDEDDEPVLLWHYAAETVFVSLPPPLRRSIDPNSVNMFWGIKDTGDSADLVFRSEFDVAHMVLFEPNTDDSGDIPNAGAQLWAIQPDGNLCAITSNGNVSKVIDLAQILKTSISVTSKVVTAREKLYAEDILVFGIEVLEQTPEFINIKESFGIHDNNGIHYVVAIDTPENTNSEGMVLFMLPTPEDMKVRGQIVGIPGVDEGRKDQLVFFAQVDGESAKFFSVS